MKGVDRYFYNAIVSEWRYVYVGDKLEIVNGADSKCLDIYIL
jgi:hypothetical protein